MLEVSIWYCWPKKEKKGGRTAQAVEAAPVSTTDEGPPGAKTCGPSCIGPTERDSAQLKLWGALQALVGP